MFLVQKNDWTIDKIVDSIQLETLLIDTLKNEYTRLARAHDYDRAYAIVSTLCEIANNNIGIISMQNMLRQHDIYVNSLAKLQHDINNFESYLKDNGGDVEDCERVLKQIEKEIKERWLIK